MADFDYFDLLGKPFARGGRGPEFYDCYGLVKEMFERTGRVVPDFESPGTLEEIEQLVSANTSKWKRVAPKTPGSLITFRVDGLGAHVGFMLGGDRFLHAIDGPGVYVERLTNSAYKPLAFYDYA